MHRFVLHNSGILDAGAKCLAPGQVGLMNGWGVFSTIRIAGGVLFAWERHWERMRRDAGRMRVPFPESRTWMEERLLALAGANGAIDATLRVAVVRNRGGLFEGPGMDRDFDLIAFTADLTPWPAAARLGLKPDARHAASEFSGVKVTSWGFNLAWHEEARERGFDEAVLLNERGEVSECTSANLFAAFGTDVVTPPLSSGCLPGVTRELLLGEIAVPGYRVREGVLLPSDLERADSVAITSTTRDAMPVESIEGLSIRNRGSAVSAMREALESYRREYRREKEKRFQATL